MTERVRIEIEKLAKKYRGREFEWETWERIIRDESDISWTTFRKYMKSGYIQFERHVYEVEKDSWEWEQGYEYYSEYLWK